MLERVSREFHKIGLNEGLVVHTVTGIVLQERSQMAKKVRMSADSPDEGAKIAREANNEKRTRSLHARC